jgi:hypothetical protein
MTGTADAASRMRRVEQRFLNHGVVAGEPFNFGESDFPS